MKIALLFTIFAVAHAHFQHYLTLQSNGIVFDKISKAHTIEKYWNIIYYYDLHSLTDDVINLQACMNELNIICLKSKAICRPTAELLNEKLEYLISEKLTDIIRTDSSILNRSKKEIFRNLLHRAVKRIKTHKKRSTVNDFFKDTLFENDLHKQLVHLEEKLLHTKTVSQKHLTLINHTVSLYNNSFEAIQSRLLNLEKKIDTTVTQENHKIEDQEKFDTLAIYALHTMNILIELTNFIKAALQNSSIDHLLKIIPLNKITKSIQLVQSQLTSHEKIGITYESDFDILKILSHEVSLINGSLAIKIEVPIGNTEEKELYKLTPIPIKLDNLHYLIRPVSEYAIINKRSSGYTPLSSNEYLQCIRISDSKLCPTSHPTYYDTLCEYEIYKLSKDAPKECTLRHIPTKNYITPLGEPNTFFVTVYHPFNITIRCPRINDTYEYVESDGKIFVNPQCEMISTNFHIKAQYAEKIPENLSMDMRNKPTVQNESLVEKDRFDEYEYENEYDTENSVQDSLTLQNEIDEQSKETYDTTTEKHILKSKLKSTSIIIIILLLLLGIYLIRKYSIPAFFINLFRFRLL